MKLLFAALILLASQAASAGTLYTCNGPGGPLIIELDGNRVSYVHDEDGVHIWSSEPFISTNGTFHNHFYLPDYSNDSYYIYTIHFKDEQIVKTEAEWSSNDHDAGGPVEAPVCVN